MQNSDTLFMNEALLEARTALGEGEIPVGCVIVRNGEIIARAHNRREQLSDPAGHAEVLAIREAGKKLNTWRLNGCSLYVTLEPCPMCAGAISQARISRLVYAAPDPAYGCAGSVYRIPEDPAFGHFCRCEGGVLEEEALALMKLFFGECRV